MMGVESCGEGQNEIVRVYVARRRQRVVIHTYPVIIGRFYKHTQTHTYRVIIGVFW